MFDIVKKLYIKVNQQETLILSKGSSETLRGNIKEPLLLKNEKMINTTKLISIHTPTHLRPLNNDQLGHYLAGLLDGDGYFHKNGIMTITYDIKDISAAYWLKNKLGFGSVYKIKNKNSVKLVISNSKGILRILELINGKLRTDNKYKQVLEILNNHKTINNLYYNKYKTFDINKSKDFNNHWLTGFIDSNGSLQIKLIQRNNNRLECRLKLQITQKDHIILENIKEFLGGYIGIRKHKNIDNETTITYYYETVSYASAKNVIKYLDKYHLISYKWMNYLKWRKVYLLIQSDQHLTLEGLEKIKKLKESTAYK